MRRLDVVLLTIGVIVTLAWAILSGRDGFKSANATIVARSLAMVATMDGQIDNDPPAVGATVKLDQLLATVYDARLDRSQLIEFESQVTYLESELGNLQQQQADLAALQTDFTRRAGAYTAWMLGDAKLKHKEFAAQHNVALAQKRLEDEEVGRARQLFEKHLTSEVEMQLEKTQAEIAEALVEVKHAQFERSALTLRAMEQDGMFLDNGDASYWNKMSDTLSVRNFDTLNRIAMMESQLVQARTRAHAERLRIETSLKEEHRAPFDGKVGAKFVTAGTRVTTGTEILQILDCTEPVVIIPVPDNRVRDFAIGMDVSVYPIDSEQQLSGRIEYISSGPMLRGDTTIRIQQEITLEGNRAIVSLDEGQGVADALQSCETARVAVAIIHAPSILASIFGWF